MTISTQTNRVSYTGNGVTTAFAFAYYFLSDSDLKVYKDGTLQTITTHYTVSGAGNPAGGTVTFLTAPANSLSVVILRDPAITQATDYVANDPFPAATHEDALDKLTMIAQRLDDRMDRAMTLSDTDISGASVTLPTPVANKGLKWNAAATAIVNTTEDIDGIATAAAASAAAAAASASTASTQASNASTSAGNASTSATNASNSASAASTSATNASNSASAASTSATNASNSASAALTSENNASASATAADSAAQAVAIKWGFDVSTTMADPGTGDIRLNNATVGSVTSIAVSAQSSASGNPDVSDYIVTWDDSTSTIKGFLVLRKSGTPATFAVFSISAITDNTTWLELTVSHIGSSGTWSAADGVYAAFTRNGDKGDTGASGSGTGDFSSNTATSVDGELVLFSGTGGKTGKRATTTGLLKATSGVLAAATAGTDYLAPTTASNSIYLNQYIGGI